jgi:hypothetical protein
MFCKNNTDYQSDNFEYLNYDKKLVSIGKLIDDISTKDQLCKIIEFNEFNNFVRVYITCVCNDRSAEQLTNCINEIIKKFTSFGCRQKDILCDYMIQY